MRADLLKQLRRGFRSRCPASLLDREVDRRVEEFVRRLMEQQIDPMQTNINWEEFRERAEGRRRRVGAERARPGRDRPPRGHLGAGIRDRGGSGAICRTERPDAGGRPRPAGEGRGAGPALHGAPPGEDRRLPAHPRDRDGIGFGPRGRYTPWGQCSGGSSVVRFRTARPAFRSPGTFTGKTVPDCLCLNACNSSRWWSSRPTAANALTTFFRGC